MKMKRKILSVLIIFTLILSCTSVVFASEAQNLPEEDLYLSIPVYNSIEEAETAIANGEYNIDIEGDDIAPLDLIGDPGGTQYCKIYAFIVREWSLSESCELYFKWESDFEINAIRFSELIVEKAPVPLAGKNYLKMTPESGKKYCTFNFGSTWSGRKTICRDFDIPVSEDSVIVRSKKMGVYMNRSKSWLECQYQMGGIWSVTPGNTG